MRTVPLLFFFFFLLLVASSVSAVVDDRDSKYTEMHEVQLEYFGERKHLVVPHQGVSITGMSTVNFATNKRLKSEYSGRYWMQRRRAIQNKVDPLGKTFVTDNPADVAWAAIKEDARDNLIDPSHERFLETEYDDYWLERSLQTYQYLAFHNPEVVQKKIAPLVYTNLREYLPYLTDVLNKRSLTVEYNEEYWDSKDQQGRHSLITSI